MPDFSTLILKSIFMHQILLVGEGQDRSFGLALTDVPVELNDRDRGFLRSRFVDALRSGALAIIPNDEVDTPTPSLVAKHIEEPGLKALSHDLAERLVAAQRMNAKSGILVVADAVMEGKTSVLIAKVEHQEAMQAKTKKLPNGDRALSIKRIPDLVFGDQNRIYKVAILSPDAEEQANISGYLADVQNSGRFATYFISEFLGMRLGDEPEVLTKKFMDTMTEAISASSMDAEAKMEAQAALSVTLKSNSQSLDPRRFVKDHIPQVHQTFVFRAALERGAPPVPFNKDIKMVKNNLDNIRIQLGSDISIVAPTEAIGSDSRIKVERNKENSVAETYNITIPDVPLENVKNTRSR
ncbi:nucleoid-associated protein [Glutamicibacter mishrai]|uniref:Nucleoid-associated protein n=1 Tax=Glutamicibacter mishrai TaxID=1775880 RepID=A0A6H0SNG6_9MICC|nr:nucleoid-associated protein [Glutamicibacter mishrai]QIV87527.1 hypothetical protein D3791_10595 [Glutamicibacter mishrai]